MSQPIPTQSYCYERQVVEKHEFTWMVDDLANIPPYSSEIVESPVFHAEGSDVKWQLILYPNSDFKSTDIHGRTRRDVISLYVKLVSCPPGGLRASYSFSILHYKNKPVHVQRVAEYIQFEINKNYGFYNFAQRNSVFNTTTSTMLVDRLKLHCEIWVHVGDSAIDRRVKVAEDKVKVPESKLVEDLTKMLESQKYSDVTLTLQGHKFKCHRNVLAARSTVFAEDLKAAVTTKLPHILSVHGELEPHAFMKLLRFIYTGEAPADLEESAEELLRAANEYQVDRLKTLCEQVLYSTLNTNNAVHRLILAGTCSAQQLKARVMEFMCEHFEELRVTTAWDCLQEHFPRFGFEMCSYLHKRISKD